MRTAEAGKYWYTATLDDVIALGDNVALQDRLHALILRIRAQ